MRRAAPTVGLSPQLIKHFAIATVSVTGLLALFVSDADWGAQAQLETTEERNRLAAAEAERLGPAKLASKSKIRRRSSIGMAGDGGIESTGGGGGLDSESPMQGRAGGYDANSPRAHSGPPGAPQVRPIDPASESPDARGPSQYELEAMLEASRQRSGSATSQD